MNEKPPKPRQWIERLVIHCKDSHHTDLIKDFGYKTYLRMGMFNWNKWYPGFGMECYVRSYLSSCTYGTGGLPNPQIFFEDPDLYLKLLDERVT